MTHRLHRLLLMLAVLALLGETTARAEEMVDFSYSWTALPTSAVPGGTGGVLIATAPDGVSSAELGSISPVGIPGATFTTNSSAPDSGPPDTFNADFNLKLHLTDTASGASGDLTFDGKLTGTLRATSSDVKATFNGDMTQSLTLGDHVYSVTIDPRLVNLPIPGSSAPALVDALIFVSGATAPPPPPPPPSEAPEPSSLVLGMIAVGGLAARRWARRLPA